MQTFIPLPSFAASARVLDRQRLGNQRNEAKLLLRLVMGELPGSRWQSHPARRMWTGYPEGLALYGYAICTEWRRRGYRDSLLEWYRARLLELRIRPEGLGRWENWAPPWWGRPSIHRSHRAALLFKNHEWYSQFGWTEEPRMAYVWPS